MRPLQKLCAALVCAACLVAATAHAEPPAASSDPKPPSGWGGLIAGGVGFGYALFSLASMPVCWADWYPTDTPVCLTTSSVGAAVGIGVGVTGVLIGKRRRQVYKEWRERELQRRGLVLDSVSAGYQAGQSTLQLRFAF